MVEKISMETGYESAVSQVEEGLVTKYPRQEDVIRGLAAMLKAYDRPTPADSSVLEISN